MDRHSEEEESLDSVPDEPQACSSRQEPRTYWLAQYFTRANDVVGVMGLKYPRHWPKEKAEETAKEVQAGDKYAVRNLPVVVREVAGSSTPPPASEISKDWSVKYRVFDSPTSMSSKTVRLNYSGIFTEEEVRADALRAVGYHVDAVPDTLVVQRRGPDSSSSTNDSYDEALNVDQPYPLLKDKDWLKKMTQSEEGTAKSASKRRALDISSPSPEKRRSLRLYDKEKEKEKEETGLGDDDADFEPQEEVEPQPPQPSTSKQEEVEPQPPQPSTSKQEEVEPQPPQPSTSKESSTTSKTTPKERFKGKVYQVRNISDATMTFDMSEIV